MDQITRESIHEGPERSGSFGLWRTGLVPKSWVVVECRMENEGPKRVSAIKPDTEILGYPYGFNCSGGSSGKRERDVKDAIERCRVDPNSIFQTSVRRRVPRSLLRTS